MSDWNWHDYKKTLHSFSDEEKFIIDTLSALQVERLKRGISQKDFTAILGMKQPQLAKIENLDSIPSLTTLNRYARGLGWQIQLKITPLQATGTNN